MIEGGWSFVWAAYAVASVAFIGMAAALIARFLYWRKQARALEDKRERRT